MVASVSSQYHPPLSAPTKGNTGTELASDFQTFLKMLTAQARYQDPLEPLDSAQYAAQLAQFSMVEQQVQTNSFLAALGGPIGGSGTLADWLGLDVRTNGPVQFAGQDIVLNAEAEPLADRHVLVIKDSLGVELGSLPLEQFTGQVKWGGRDDKGRVLAHGLYTFEVVAFLNEEELSRRSAGTFETVAEARILDGQVDLVFRNGISVPAHTVVAARNTAPYKI